MADQLITGTTLVESTSRSNGDVPVGGIIPWLKNMTGVYNISDGWVECNGQTLVDSLSSLNGQVIPDLNGENRFLRGNSTSGDTGGSTSLPAHDHKLANIGGDGENLYLEGGYSSSGTITCDRKISSSSITSTSKPLLVTGDMISNKTVIPPYYNVVWVMRVR